MKGNVPNPWRRTLAGALWTLPVVVLLAVFVYWPLGRTVALSRRGSDLFGRPTVDVGWRYYGELFTDSATLHAIGVTLLFAVLATAMTLGGALAVVLPLRHRVPGGAFFQTVFSLPFAYSAASASVCFSALYNPAVGVFNRVLHAVGLGPVGWLTDPAWALPSVAAATAWWQSGFAALVLIAALRLVPGEVLEAARLDGASELRITLRIVLPLITPSVFFLSVTGLISGLQTFTQIQVLTRGGPANATTTLVYDLYQTAFGNGLADYGRASALAVFLFALVLAMTGLQFGLLERRVHYR